jgi:hypothetical protein
VRQGYKEKEAEKKETIKKIVIIMEMLKSKSHPNAM